MGKPVVKEHFGKTSKGEDVYKFTLANEKGLSVGILNFGCVVYEIKYPDRDGNVVDVNLGFDNVKDYEVNNNYFGALCGRVANRIGGAQFTLDGETHTLSKNDPFGGHWCHGGHVGFSRRVWAWSIKEDRLTLRYTDPDGSEGMPGEVTTHVTYSIDDEGVLEMDYRASTDKPTVVDVGSHFMVNLAGHGKGAIRDHVVTIASDKYLEPGDDMLPSGKYVSVEDDKVMDFRKPTLLEGDRMEKLSGGFAFHHAYVYDEPGKKKFMARADHPATKRYLEVYSTNTTVFVYSNHFMLVVVKDAPPCTHHRVDHPTTKRYLEVYSSNTTVFAYSNHFMKIVVGDAPCKDGVVYEQFAAIEFMPMGYPNSINQPNFPQSVIRPGEPYRQTAWYKFGVAE